MSPVVRAGSHMVVIEQAVPRTRPEYDRIWIPLHDTTEACEVVVWLAVAEYSRIFTFYIYMCKQACIASHL